MNKGNQKNVKVSFNYEAYKRFREKRIPGLRFIGCKGFCREIEFYIACHEAAGIHLDTECQTICYDDRIVLTLRKESGVWRIIDVTVKDSATAYRPLFTWKLIKRGIEIFPARFLNGWCPIRSGAASMA